MTSALQRIRELLKANLQGRFIHLQFDEDGRLEITPGNDNKRDTLGFIKEGKILVEPTAWCNVLCAGFDPQKTARHLRKLDLLICNPGKLQKQEKVVRGGLTVNARFYVLAMSIMKDAAGMGPAGGQLMIFPT